MTQEDKELLLKDLCARLPYGVKVWYPNGSGVISTVKGIVNGVCYFNDNPRYDNRCNIEAVKPYLRPMSSMTEEEKALMATICLRNAIGNVEGVVSELSDFYNSRYFDYRGLIPMGLALEAKEGMYD